MSPLSDRRVASAPIAETLRQATRACWSGLLRVLDRGEQVGSLVLRDGRLAWATARGQREDLAGALLRAGLLDEGALARVRRQYQTPGKLGALAELIERERGLTRQEVRRYLLLHLRDVVHGIVSRGGLATAAADERVEAVPELTFGWDELFVEDAREGWLAVRPGEPEPARAPGPRVALATPVHGAPARTIALVSAKGGVGRTTTALNLAVAFAARARPTLLVDADPQGGVALALGLGDGGRAGLQQLLAGTARPADVVERTRLEGLSIVPRGALDAAGLEDNERCIGSGAFEEAIRDLGRERAYVLVDTPAGLGPVTRAVLWAADLALVPTQVEPSSLRTLDQALAAIEHARARANPRLALLGILPTMVRRDDEASVAALLELRASRARVLATDIPRSERFIAASERGLPLSLLGGSAIAEARCFDALAAECEALIDAMPGGAEREIS